MFLQFGGNIAFRILQRLAPDVVLGDPVGMGPGHVYKKSLNTVVVDFEVWDTGLFPLPCLEIQQELRIVLAHGAQFVEFGIVALAYYITVTYEGRRFVRNGIMQEF